MKYWITAILLAAIALYGCRPIGSNITVDERGWPTVLRIGHNPPEEETQRMAREEVYSALAEYLGKTLNIDVEITKTGSYSIAIEAMRSKKIDICQFGSFSYLIAHEKANAEPLVIIGTEESHHGSYQSYLLTSPSSGLKNMDDVLEKSKSLTFSFNDPASTSGHLVPRGYFDSIGVKPEVVFGKVVYSMSHTANIMTALAGKVDVAAIASTTLARLVELGTIEESEFHVLWKSDWMPTGPVAIRGDLPSDFKQSIQDAYINMHNDAPDTWALVSSIYLSDNPRFFPGDDSVYDYYRAIVKNMDQMQLLSD